MASAENYAQWLIANEDKKGTDSFNTVAEAYKAARNQQNMSKEPEKPKEESGRFGAALGRSWQGVKEAAQGVGLGITSAIDTPEHAQRYMDKSKELQKEEVAGPKSMSFEDLQNVYKNEGILSGLAETPGFAAEKFTESSIESLAPFVAGGIAGAYSGGTLAPIVTGIVTSIIQQFGHDMARQAQEKVQAGELSPGDAIAAAVPQGALDYVADRFTFGMKMTPGATSAIKDAAKKEIEKSIGERIFGGAIKGALTEPPTEIAQQALERGQAGLPITGEEAQKEYKEAGGSALAAGALGGSAFGAVQRENKNQYVTPEAEQTQTITPEVEPVTPEVSNINTGMPVLAGEEDKQDNLIHQTFKGVKQIPIDRNQIIYDKDGNETTAGEYYDKHIAESKKSNDSFKKAHAFNSTLKLVNNYLKQQNQEDQSNQENQIEEDVPYFSQDQKQITDQGQNKRAPAASDTSAPLGASSTEEQRFEITPPPEEQRFEITPPPEEQPVEEQPIEEQPVEEQPVEEQPIEEQPIEEQPIEEQPVEEQAVIPTAPKEKKTTAPKSKANVKVRLPKEKITEANKIIKKVEDQIASGTNYSKTPNAVVALAKSLNVYDAGWTPAQQLTAVKDRLSEAQELGIAHKGDIFPDILANTKEALGVDKNQINNKIKLVEDKFPIPSTPIKNLPKEEKEVVKKAIKKAETKYDKNIPKEYKYDKGYTPTEQPSAENFLNQNSEYNTGGPKTVKEGIDHAAFAAAADKFDINKNIKEQAINKKEAVANRRAFVKSLTKQQRELYVKKLNSYHNIETLSNAYAEKRSRTNKTIEDQIEDTEDTEDTDIKNAIEYAADEYEKERKYARRVKESNEELEWYKEESKRKPVKIKNKITNALDTVMKNPVFPSLGDVSFLLNTINLKGTLRSTRAIADKLSITLEAVDNRTGVLALPKVVYGDLQDVDGEFNPNTNIITLKGSKEDGYTGKRNLDEVILHELTHYLIDHVVENPSKYIKSLTNSVQQTRVKEGIARLKKLHKAAQIDPNIKGNFEIGSLKEFIAETISNPEFQLALGNMPYIGNKKLRERFKSFFTDVIDAISRALGFENTSNGVALENALYDVLNLISRPTEFTKAKDISYSKQAPTYAPTGAYSDLDKDISLYGQRAERNKDITGSSITHSYQNIVRLYQNSSVYLKNWENTHRLADFINDDPEGAFNNVNVQKTLAQEVGRQARKENVILEEEKLINDVNNLTKTLGFKDTNYTLNLLHNFKLGLHGVERRETKYYLTKDLDTKPIFKDPEGSATPVSAKGYRDAILKMLRTDKKLTEKQCQDLWEVVKHLGNNYAMPDPINNDITNDKYNSVGITSAEEQRMIQDYNDLASSNPAAKVYVDNIFKTLQTLNDNVKKLDRKSNYMSNPVENIINFYGWKNYSPFKGIPEHNAVDSTFDYGKLKTSNTYKEMADPWAGNIDDSENCIVQTITDAYKACDRTGYRNVTEAVKNAVNTVIKGKPLLNAKIHPPMPFSEREKFKEMGQKLKEHSILHYNKDGSVNIIEFDRSAVDILNGIRRQYIPTGSLTNKMSVLTSAIGQFHTRYNINFAPMNFFRDMLTNAWTMGAEQGVGLSAKYISTVATDVALNMGIRKAFNIARMYEKNDIASIRELAKSKDSFTRHIAEYILHGGKVSHRAAMSLKENYDRMDKIGNKHHIAHTLDSINTVVDTWNEMFELASRASAYKSLKAKYIKEALKNKVPLDSAERSAGIRAAADAKNLANFEQTGLYSKHLGAWFMFSRPAATGAVRALDALLPAFTFKNSWALKNLPNSGAFTYKIDPTTHRRIYDNQKAVNDYTKSFSERRKNAQIMAGALVGMGMLVYTMAKSMADDDDKGRNRVSNDNPDQWTKFARFHIPGHESPIQIPWGFGLGAFAAIGAQMAMVMDPDNKVSPERAFSNIATQISFDSYLPVPISRIDFMDDPLRFVIDSVAPSISRPLVEYAMNKNGLGQAIYSTTGSHNNAYSGRESTPEAYRIAARYLADSTNGVINVTPNTLSFFANNYADGLSKFIEVGTGISLIAQGKKELDFTKDTFRKDIPFVGSFFGAKANVDSREFGSVEKQIKDIKDDLDMFKTNPKEYAEYIERNPMAPAIVSIYDNSKGKYLDKLNHIKNVYERNPDLSPIERRQLVKPIDEAINNVKYTLVNTFKDYGIKPY